MTQVQRRTLGMHPNLLMDVIQRQAGSISKALLEAVMNSIDAGAGVCEITLEAERFAVVDDVRGFQSQTEIDAHFETFGTPHQEGDATYGRFRMGRGQLMAFGRNRWTSNVFRMDVYIKVDGLDYHLTVAPENEAIAGCRIEVELYEPMLPSDLQRTQRELRDMVAFAQIPVVLNGTTISKPPHEQTWDHTDANAY